MRPRKKLSKHGTVSRYYTYKCRCAKCKKFAREYMRDFRAKLRQKAANEIPHGVNGYQNYGCRCEICSTASKNRLKAK